MVLNWLQPDGKKLLVTSARRTFGYGYLAVVLGLYLQQLELSAFQVGIVLTAAVAGSALMNVFWSLAADRFRRRRTIATTALLMIASGLLFAFTDRLWLRWRSWMRTSGPRRRGTRTSLEPRPALCHRCSAEPPLASARSGYPSSSPGG